MSSIDLHNDEIGIKVVYYGPGLGGKTSSLKHMHTVLNPENRGRMISLATGIDRTLYFDFLPIQLPKINKFSIRMSVYTVPGQVHYDATRKLVLQGADGVVFVADSQEARNEANQESIENLKENLKTHGMNPDTIPLVIQYNKRDLGNIMPVDQMDKDLNWRNVPAYETDAINGDGVLESLKTITKLVLSDLRKQEIYNEKPKEPIQEPVKTIKQEGLGESSTTLSAAIVNAAESQLPESIAPQTSESINISDSEDSEPSENSNSLWAPLWEDDNSTILELEQMIIENNFNLVVQKSEKLLKTIIE